MRPWGAGITKPFFARALCKTKGETSHASPYSETGTTTGASRSPLASAGKLATLHGGPHDALADPQQDGRLAAKSGARAPWYRLARLDDRIRRVPAAGLPP
jgi:hypothetical protein